MVCDDEEAINGFNLAKIDIFLLDLDNKEGNQFKLIEYLTEKNLRKHRKSIAAITQNFEKADELKNNPFIYQTFLKPVGMREVFECLEELAGKRMQYRDEQIIKERIQKQLEILSFNFSYNGTKFLSDVIYEIYTNKNKFHDNLTKDIYPIIADRYGKTVNTIKCDITQATKVMYYDCREEVVMKYFNYKMPIKPRVKEVIFTILNKI